MSRAYDAKQQALKAYPNDREAACDLFVEFLDMGQSDIEYELGESVEKYIFGDEKGEPSLR